MYNPSEHIPLSKPLGAGRFPIDGKFMFYTNGVGGVFAYRPFVNLTEVYNYFPLGSDFRKGNFEILVNTGGTLSGDGGSISGGSNDVYWWKDGLTNADLVLKNAGGSATKTVISKLGSDVDSNGNLDLTAETIPSNALYQVYINGISGYVAVNYDEIAKIMGGFNYPMSEDIKIIFI